MNSRQRALAVITATAALVVSGQAVASAAAPGAKTTTTVSVDSATISAIVGGQLPAASPSGKVTFSVDGKKVGVVTLPRPAKPTDTVTATLKYHVPTGKTRHIGAAYAGDKLYAASQQTIVRADPTITKTFKSAHPKTKYGWYRSPVTVAFHCVKHGSPIVCPSPLHFSSNGKGQSGSVSTYAADGGAATARVKHINIDMQKPTLTVTGTGRHAVCHPHDAISGIASCSIRHTNSHYRAVAIDRAGNRRVVSVRS
jgi:hypothetical protein